MPLVVAANRDEFHARASAQAGFWDDHADVLAGRDLLAGGSWLGCNRQGKFAALTNFNRGETEPAAQSRGVLVENFLTSEVSAHSYASAIDGSEFAGFNLLLFDGEHLLYTNNVDPADCPRILEPGTYGLSNAELGAAWPKCTSGAAALEAVTNSEFDNSDLVNILNDESKPADEALPQRGRPLEMERHLSACFINGNDYGTRASTAFILRRDHIEFVEQTYYAGGVVGERVEFSLPVATAGLGAAESKAGQMQPSALST